VCWWITSGSSLKNDTVSVTFTIYDAELVGSVKWTETDTVITDGAGVFTLVLGKDSPIPDSVFSDSLRWLGIQVEAEPELIPRTQLVSGPYSYVSGSGPSGGSSGWTDDGTVVRLTTGTDSVGIGTTSPGEPLEVAGNVLITGKATIGSKHTNTGLAAFVAGDSSTASGFYSTVGGGLGNESSNDQTVVAGGAFNTASGVSTVVSGGYQNAATAADATVAGGFADTASGFRSTVSGGNLNSATVEGATVGGGARNVASGINSTVSGGFGNVTSGRDATIGGGAIDTAVGDAATISGGVFNMAVGDRATIAGGIRNRADGSYSSIGGGGDNLTTQEFGTIGGGRFNYARGIHSTVAGGGGSVDSDSNSAMGDYSVISGGLRNNASGEATTISGGFENLASGIAAVVGGGNRNVASGIDATVPGGYGNEAGEFCSFAAGFQAKALHLGSFVWADRTQADFVTTDSNQFLIRANFTGIGRNYKITGAETFGIRRAIANAWLTYSSRRWKSDIQTMTDALAKVDQLRGVTYKDKESGEPSIGVIAEEVGEIFPEIVTYEDNGVDAQSVDYSRLVSVLIEAVKELKTLSEEQSARIDELRTEVAALSGNPMGTMGALSPNDPESGAGIVETSGEAR
jgi:hypothetical protein